MEQGATFLMVSLLVDKIGNRFNIAYDKKLVLSSVLYSSLGSMTYQLERLKNGIMNIDYTYISIYNIILFLMSLGLVSFIIYTMKIKFNKKHNTYLIKDARIIRRILLITKQKAIVDNNDFEIFTINSINNKATFYTTNLSYSTHEDDYRSPMIYIPRQRTNFTLDKFTGIIKPIRETFEKKDEEKDVHINIYLELTLYNTSYVEFVEYINNKMEEDIFGNQTYIYSQFNFLNTVTLPKHIGISFDSDFEKRKKIYLEDYFHQNSDYIYNEIYNSIVNKPMNKSQLNFLLHGPPGTGKSILINKLSKIFYLDIQVINILDFIDNKTEFYDLLCIHTVNTNNMDKTLLSMKQEKPRVIKFNLIVFEEFDSAIKILVQRNQLKKRYNDKLKYITMNQENKHDEKSTDISWYNPKELQIEDIQILLQGPCEFPGRFVIATTNDYDYLKNNVPVLVRDGRLTPIEFNQMNMYQLKRLVNYYFGAGYDKKIPDDLNYTECNAKINRLASYYSKMNMFEQFLNDIKR